MDLVVTVRILVGKMKDCLQNNYLLKSLTLEDFSIETLKLDNCFLLNADSTKTDSKDFNFNVSISLIFRFE